MKQTNHLKPLCAAVFLALLNYGCSGDEQQAGDKAATSAKTSAERPAGTTESEGAEAEMSPSLLSSNAESSSDISAMREENSAAQADAQEEPEVDDETAIRNQIDQYRKAKDPEMRVQILEEIGNINADDLAAVTLFTEAVQDKSSEVRLAAVGQLSTSEAEASADGLITALHDSNTEVVLQAIDALTSKNDSRIPGELSRLLTHKNQDIRDAASDAIDSLQEE